MFAFSRRSINHRRGFSLIEAAIVLGMVGGIVGVVWKAATASNESFKINQTVQGVNAIAANVQRLLRPYRTTTSQISGTNDAFFTGTEGFRLIGSTRYDPFSNNISFNHLAATTWQLVLFSVTPSRCIKIVTALSTTASITGLYEVRPPSGNPVTPPVTVAQANTECSNTGRVYLYFNLFN